MKKERVTKVEAAVRQIDTAIKLWFSDGDLVSIHVLTSSAYEIIEHLNKNRGGKPLLYDSHLIKDEDRNGVLRQLKLPWNFFKHANNDPNNVLVLNTNYTEGMLELACQGIKILKVAPTELMHAYHCYFQVHHEECMDDEETAMKDQLSPLELKTILEFSKSEFLAWFWKS